MCGSRNGASVTKLFGSEADEATRGDLDGIFDLKLSAGSDLKAACGVFTGEFIVTFGSGMTRLLAPHLPLLPEKE